MYESLFQFALELFNEKMGADLHPELILVSRKNIVPTFNKTISRIGASREPITSPSYLNGMVAEALVGERGAAVLLRMDVQMSESAIVHTLLHELAHIYCILNEYGGKSFQNIYCRDEENQFLIKGYSIWSEFVAEYMVRRIEDGPALNLRRRRLAPFLNHIRVNDPKAERAMSDYLVRVVTGQEAADLPFQNLILLVRKQLRKEEYYKITDDFISEVGSTYFYELAMEEMRRKT